MNSARNVQNLKAQRCSHCSRKPKQRSQRENLPFQMLLCLCVCVLSLLPLLFSPFASPFFFFFLTETGLMLTTYLSNTELHCNSKWLVTLWTEKKKKQNCHLPLQSAGIVRAKYYFSTYMQYFFFIIGLNVNQYAHIFKDTITSFI